MSRADGAGRALPDAEARRRVAEDLDRSLVVAAGAGTGKTTALVSRVVSLVRRGAPVRELAVITFTEAAAAELRTRVAEALAGAAQKDPANAALAAAVAEVDEAAVCTLHAFAQRILVEHAVAAGLPPGFDVLDELSERAELEARLVRFTDQLLDDPGAETMVLRGFGLGLGARAMSEVAWCLHRHWDRLEDGALERIEAARPPAGSWPALDVTALRRALEEVLAMEPLCTDPADGLARHLAEQVRPAYEALTAAACDEQAALALVARHPGFGCGRGRADNWQQRAAQVRQACAEAEAARQALVAQAGAPVVAEMLARLARFTLQCAAARLSEGRLTFHDLLVHARRILRADPSARAAVRRRYRWLLVDEFQDTDPLQVDLAAWLASAVEGSGELADARPGALFVVGDPKQSIYRFRRAEIALYARVSAAVGDELVLGANFRSVPGIVRFVNSLFPALFGPPQAGQAAYHPLMAERPALRATPGTSAVQLRLAGVGEPAPDPDERSPAAVAVVGGPLEATVGEVRRAAAGDLASAVSGIVRGGWPVSDPEGGGPPRAARWRDIAVLIPTRTSLPPLEEAFDEAGVPYRLEGAALLWGSDEVRDVRSALAAADEPSDAVSVLAALRSPGLGCGEDDLVDWHRRGGSWDPRAEVPEGAGRHSVARAMAVLLDLHRRRWWCEPSELVAGAVEAMAGYALAFAHRRPRQVWHRLDWLVDQARLFDDTAAGSLHDFLCWAELQSEGDGRTPSLGPPEPDDDAVRVMTVHGAKGLEFPVVVLAGLERDDAGQRDAVLWGDAGGAVVPEVSFGPQLRSGGYEAAAAGDRELDRLERVRLLYVAMTRARDHLVLGLHHKVRNGTPDNSQAAVLDELCRAHPLLWRRLPGAGAEPAPVPAGVTAGRSSNGHGPGDQRAGGPSAGGEEALAARRWATELWQWTERRASLVEQGRALAVVSASRLWHGPGPDGAEAGTTSPGGGGDGPVGDEWNGWPGGRGGADMGLDIGRAVHGTLAAVDLGSGRDPGGREASAVARQRAQSHKVADHADDVVRMVAGALSSPIVGWAAGRRHHKEVYLGMALGTDDRPAVFEGFADLVVEDDDGLVVVDYKTDRVPDAATLDLLTGRYALQVGAYAEAAGVATGRPVLRAVLLFLAGAAPVERVLEGEALDRARADARAAMG